MSIRQGICWCHKKRKPLQLQKVVHDNNVYLSGITRVDRMRSAYPTERKRQKYGTKNSSVIYWTCVSTTSVHTLYIKIGRKIITFQFWEKLFEEFVLHHLEWIKKVKKGRPSHEEDPLRLVEHYFSELVPKDHSVKGLRKCTVCSNKNVHWSTRYKCTQCDKCLCIVSSFKIFHTQLKKAQSYIV